MPANMPPLTEQQIRQIVQSEIQAQNSAGRFGLNMTPSHYHSGNAGDGPQISQDYILPGDRLEGSITFAQQTTYQIGTNFNPTAVWVHGNATGASGEKFLIVGNAQLGGNSFYLQPGTTTSVLVGGTPETIIQSNTYFGGTSGTGGSLHTIVDEGHIANIEYPTGTIYARATITAFSNKAITLVVDTLSSGWELNLSFTIT
jgi:hypothetical protein